MTRSRHIILGILLVFCVCAGGNGYAAAHELQQDHGVSAVLHIYPDDNPQTGRQTHIGLDFTSTIPGFDLASCGCSVNARSISGQQLRAAVVPTDNAAANGHAALTFPEAGLYDLQVTGRAAKQSETVFSLSYPVRVSAAGGTTAGGGTGSWQVILLSVMSLVLLGYLAAHMLRRGGRYNTA